MRPIDADALIKAIIQMPPNGIVFDCIHEAPTINPEPHWIPCSERLPEVGKTVLLTTTFPTVIYGWLKSDGKWLIYEGDGNSFQDYITAWMPLPEPYQERGEQE